MTTTYSSASWVPLLCHFPSDGVNNDGPIPVPIPQDLIINKGKRIELSISRQTHTFLCDKKMHCSGSLPLFTIDHHRYDQSRSEFFFQYVTFSLITGRLYQSVTSVLFIPSCRQLATQFVDLVIFEQSNSHLYLSTSIVHNPIIDQAL